jgi:hypothetical protein
MGRQCVNRSLSHFGRRCDYLQAAGHDEYADGPLFRPLKNPAGQGNTGRPLTHGAIYHGVLRTHAGRRNGFRQLRARTPCGPRPPPTAWTAGPTWAGSGNGWGMPRLDQPPLRPASLPSRGQPRFPRCVLKGQEAPKPEGFVLATQGSHP